MERYAFEAPPNFLGLPEAASRRETSRVLVLPVPYEATTSYGGGARNGPAAILAASRQIELYDRELDDEPALRWGVHTLPPLARNLRSPEAAMEAIAAAVEDLAAEGKLLAVLGGEHSITIGAVRGLRRRYPELVVVQLDAHADLRDSYEGSPWSHACVARRLAEAGRVIQAGIRSLDRTEAEFLRGNPDRVTAFFADELLARSDATAAVAAAVRSRDVYLTLDVDVLDPSLMPATGTPEPGGLPWNALLAIVREVCRAARVVAFDCVELAPIPGMHAPDFTAARLVYKTMTYALAGPDPRPGGRP